MMLYLLIIHIFTQLKLSIMKKLLLITLAFSIFINFSLLAQEKEVKTYKNFVGGSFYISSGKGTGDIYLPDFDYLGFRTVDYTYIQIKPVVGFQINEHAILGIRPIYTTANRNGFDYNSFQNNNIVNQNIGQYGLGLFGRFMTSTKNKLSFGVETDVSFSKTNNLIVYANTILNPTVDLGSSQVIVGLRPVLSYQIAPRFRFLGYFGNISYTKKKYTVYTNRNSSNFSSDFSLRYISLGGEFLF